MNGDERLQKAQTSYEQAIFGGDPGELPAAARQLDALDAELCLARGKLLHAGFLDQRVEDPAELPLFTRAAELTARLGDARGEGEALFWIGCFHQVVRQDDAVALPLFERSRDLAERSGDRLTLSYALRHLGLVAHAAGHLDEARAHLAESTRLRRELGFAPGVAANLIGLAYIAAAQDRGPDARTILDEATILARDSGAAGITHHIEEARKDLT